MQKVSGKPSFQTISTHDSSKEFVGTKYEESIRLSRKIRGIRKSILINLPHPFNPSKKKRFGRPQGWIETYYTNQDEISSIRLWLLLLTLRNCFLCRTSHKQEELVFRIGTLPLFCTRRVSNLRSTAIRVTAGIGKTNFAAKYHSSEISDEFLDSVHDRREPFEPGLESDRMYRHSGEEVQVMLQHAPLPRPVLQAEAVGVGQQGDKGPAGRKPNGLYPHG